MCNDAGLRFVHDWLPSDMVNGQRVLDVGSLNVNGSARDIMRAHGCAEYVGVDIRPGHCVTRICNVVDLVATFGPSSFPIVISTEMMEHAEDWPSAIYNLTTVCEPGGIIVLTTRSKGFGLHNFPHDHWRYEVEDMRTIFKDWFVRILADPDEPGVFVGGVKAPLSKMPEIPPLALYNINRDERVPYENRNMVEYFNRYVQRVKAELGDVHGLVLKTDVWNAVKKKPPGGFGPFMPHAELYHIDIHDKHLDKARNPFGLAAWKGDIRDIPFGAEHFAAVLDTSTIDHVAEYEKVVAEYHRVLKPHGKLLLFAWTAPDIPATLQFGDQYIFPLPAFKAVVNRLFDGIWQTHTISRAWKPCDYDGERYIVEFCGEKR